MNLPIALQPGDTLLYSKSDVFGLITSIKTWSPAVHVEKYEGDGQSLASRNGIGVNRYPVRAAQLCAVLRPNQPINMAAVKKWFEVRFDRQTRRGVRGRPYGWLDLLRFYGMRIPTNGWICSQFAASADRAGGLNSFAKQYYAGTIDPGDFFLSPAYDWAWVRHDVLEDITK
jgi:hypothetical protein